MYGYKYVETQPDRSVDETKKKQKAVRLFTLAQTID